MTNTYPLPIIAITANAFEEDVQKALEAGETPRVAKTVKVKHLQLTLCTLLS